MCYFLNHRSVLLGALIDIAYRGIDELDTV